MISPELHAQIRRLFFAEHWRVNTIAAQLGVHHDTVRRAVESERFIRPGTQVRPSALDPYKAFILATLEQYPRLRTRSARAWQPGKTLPLGDDGVILVDGAAIRHANAERLRPDGKVPSSIPNRLPAVALLH